MIIPQESSKRLRRYILDLIHPGDIVIDVGAYHGFYTLFASRVVGEEGYVVAFEPHLLNFGILALNISLNSVYNVEAIKVALRTKNEDGKLYIHEASPRHSIIYRRQRYIPIKIRKLDDMIKELGFENIPISKNVDKKTSKERN
ncbi:MAG: hypothetical protein DRP00_03760 [Candidatus Aenigmatarchaeota archaeon]|nr:MAG: hypothetical protein DRP00_03760 [Candidatus Aenigmarchaeota archaeon]